MMMIQTHNLYDTSAVLSITEVMGSNPVQAWILLKLCITVTINHVSISFSAVQIYDLSYIHLQKWIYLNQFTTYM